jgi:hypothetical protein
MDIRKLLIIPFVLIMGFVAVVFIVLADLWDIHLDRKGVKHLKFKDLGKLAAEVQKAVQFAEQIKTKITTDLLSILEMKDFINGHVEILTKLGQQLAEAEKTLKNLKDLIE